jgi:dephospho-CoA kinase
MNKWHGKYVIGLTGNIATGKSVVRKMLEYLGAYGIDADALGHRTLEAESPGYTKIVAIFGTHILNERGQIDRARLGRIVFSDTEALKLLESTVHPLIRQAIDLLVQRAPQKVIVIEAIKLLEGELYTVCDSIWVVHSSQTIQLSRLMHKRKMSEADALQRITAQPLQENKLAVADVIIQNENSFEDTWNQVVNAWTHLFPDEANIFRPLPTPGASKKMTVQRAYPYHAKEIARFIAQFGCERQKCTRFEIMAEFGRKSFITLYFDDKIVGLLDWQVDDFVARAGRICFASTISQTEGMQLFLEEIERASQEYPCEAILLFLPPRLAQRKYKWQKFGYEIKAIEELPSRVWQEAARESMLPDTVILFKQLQQKLVLRDSNSK